MWQPVSAAAIFRHFFLAILEMRYKERWKKVTMGETIADPAINGDRNVNRIMEQID